MKHVWLKLFLIAGDVVGIYLVLFITMLISASSDRAFLLLNLDFTSTFSYLVILIVAFVLGGLYRDTRIKSVIEHSAHLISSITVAVILIYTFNMLAIRQSKSAQLNPLLLGLIILLISILWRYIFNKICNVYNLQERVALIGNDPLIDKLEQALKSHQEFGYRCVLKLPSFEDDETKSLIRANKVDTLVVAEKYVGNPINSQQLTELLMPNVSFITATNFYENSLRRLPVNQVNASWILEAVAKHPRPGFRFMKRIFDVILGTVGLLLSLPVIAIVAIFVKAESKGPALYFQKRTGLGGSVFTAIKIRTMIENAETEEPLWAEEGDERATFIGRLLRRIRVDELPQFINIIKGEMSLIGPRPERPALEPKLEREIPFYNLRYLVKPGLTGWAQVNYHYGASVKDAIEKLEYDLYYIMHQSLPLDIEIILRTIWIVLKAKGR